jgi:hypothetical protein
MLSFRQISSVVWTFLGFMLVASLVLNLRYKGLDDGDALYLDTWTGKIQSAIAVAPAIARSGRTGNPLEIIVLERLERLKQRQVEAQKIETECGSVRFAFPAPVIRYRR